MKCAEVLDATITCVYERASSENLEPAIEIWITMPLSCNLSTLLLRLPRVSCTYRHRADEQRDLIVIASRSQHHYWHATKKQSISHLSSVFFNQGMDETCREISGNEGPVWWCMSARVRVEEEVLNWRGFSDRLFMTRPGTPSSDPQIRLQPLSASYRKTADLLRVTGPLTLTPPT